MIYMIVDGTATKELANEQSAPVLVDGVVS